MIVFHVLDVVYNHILVPLIIPGVDAQFNENGSLQIEFIPRIERFKDLFHENSLSELIKELLLVSLLPSLCDMLIDLLLKSPFDEIWKEFVD